MSRLLGNLKVLHVDPFTNEKMDIYQFCCYYSIVEKLYQGMNYQMRRFCYTEWMSNWTWLNPIDIDDHESDEFDLINSLEDPRDCSMKNVFSIESLLVAENNIEFFARQPEKLDKVYLTPNFR